MATISCPQFSTWLVIMFFCCSNHLMKWGQILILTKNCSCLLNLVNWNDTGQTNNTNNTDDTDDTDQDHLLSTTTLTLMVFLNLLLQQILLKPSFITQPPPFSNSKRPKMKKEEKTLLFVFHWIHWISIFGSLVSRDNDADGNPYLYHYSTIEGIHRRDDISSVLSWKTSLVIHTLAILWLV